jgi:hypothetical protein
MFRTIVKQHKDYDGSRTVQLSELFKESGCFQCIGTHANWTERDYNSLKLALIPSPTEKWNYKVYVRNQIFYSNYYL